MKSPENVITLLLFVNMLKRLTVLDSALQYQTLVNLVKHVLVTNFREIWHHRFSMNASLNVEMLQCWIIFG